MTMIQQRMYYTQRFDNGPLDIEEERQVSLEEARQIVTQFYASGFQNGEILTVGFGGVENNTDYIEFSKDETGKVSLIRINKLASERLEEKETDIDSGLRCLETFWG